MNQSINRRDFVKYTGLGASTLALGSSAFSQEQGKRPNIVWICVEDMSAHMSCYGETTIKTPNIDRLAREGTQFNNAYVTCPVCSPSRSAMVTGMYQTSTGTHNHRSSRHEVKIHLPDHIKTIPEYFQQAGYYTSNGGMLSTNPDKPTNRGKTDYNFEFNPDVYDGHDWRGRKEGQPFFAQFQLRGGKNRGAKVKNPVDPKDVNLPPYYPDHPVLREDWANYLNSVLHVDEEVGIILDELEKDGELENTIIFFWTDHGISHIRDKQYAYEGGMHVPLIVKGPGIPQGEQVNYLVEHIDIPTTSMNAAGIDIPGHIQGLDLFAQALNPREFVVSARDRCDETVDRIRGLRTERYKYIRNYFPNRSHTQPNRYKNGKQIMKTMRKLYAEGELNDVQDKPFLPQRPPEELYDLQNDPYELNNLADSSEHLSALQELRAMLILWEDETKDLGQFPEPCLVELAKDYKSFYAVLQYPKNQKLAKDLREIWGQEQYGSDAIPLLKNALLDDRPTIRFQAAMEFAKLGNKAKQAKPELISTMSDDSSMVRVAAAWAVSELGDPDKARPVLVKEMGSAKNEVVRHYAAMGLEYMGDAAKPALDAIQKARKDNYDYVKRVATRTFDNLNV